MKLGERIGGHWIQEKLDREQGVNMIKIHCKHVINTEAPRINTNIILTKIFSYKYHLLTIYRIFKISSQ